MIQRALLSVSDKEGIIPLAKFLESKNIEIVSTGGTAKLLESEGIRITPITEITGNPEAFGGRMKSISFQVGSGLLFRRNNKQDVDDLNQLGIKPIDLVVCNLYPFAEVLSRGGEEEELIENIDIGGPTMIRAAAKNFESVTCLTRPSQYSEFMKNFENLKLGDRRSFSAAAFEMTAEYDSMISDYMSDTRTIKLKNLKELRYGENPHQSATLGLISNLEGHSGIANAPILQGKALSYNNLLDADASWKCNSDAWMAMGKKDFAVTVVKHANPCGVAVAKTNLEALEQAWASDPISAFGSIITFSHEVDEKCANWLSNKFIEIVIAPSFSEDAKEIFAKKKNLRLLECSAREEKTGEQVYRSIAGGILIQDEDELIENEFQDVTKVTFDATKKELTRFGLAVGKYLKSNAITLVGMKGKSFVLAGAGMGQPNRLDSLKMLAAPRAVNLGFDLSEVVLISDAFFPFRDSIDVAHEVGIKYLVQPGGSIRDKEVIDACDEHGMSMVFTGHRHFRH
jgi:phosphoribosylaminoimidazolecarboxamide formyltransferase/IMP cyclohydrolase